MPGYQIQVQGLKEALRQYEELADKLQPAVGRGLLRGAALMVETAQQLVNPPSPPPSVPGEPPHTVTGTLKRSIRVESATEEEAVVAAGGAGDFAPYAAHLEFGTSKMEPRPFMFPAAVAIEPLLPGLIAEEVSKDIQGAVA